MVDAVDIRDRASLEAWLKGRPQKEAVAVATRAALRVAPLYWGWLAHTSRRDDLTELAICRPLLIAGVAAVRPSPAIRSVAELAINAADAAIAGATTYYVTSFNKSYVTSDGKLLVTADNADAQDAARATQAAVHSAAYADPDATAYAASAAGASAEAADRAAAHAAVATLAIWYEIRADCLELEGRADPMRLPLWTGAPPDWLPAPLPHEAWPMREGPGWQLWHDWYEGYLTGHPLDIGLLEQIARIAPEDWRTSDAHVNGIIEGIYQKYKGSKGDPDQLVDQAVRKATKPPKSTVKRVRAAISANREALPPTFDAIEAAISCEIEREQTRNYKDDLDREEADRRIGVLLTLHAALTQLRATVPKEGDILEPQAEAAVTLLKLYGDKLRELPREKVDEVVEGLWDTGKGTVKVTLILGSVAMAGLFGLPSYIGVALGSMAFARKGAGKIIQDAMARYFPPK